MGGAGGGGIIRKALGIDRAPWSRAVDYYIDAKLLRTDG